MNRWHSAVWVLPLSIVLAICLDLLPLPASWQFARPWWLAVVVAWWVVEAPQRTGLGVVFGIGLLTDMSRSSLLGEHALRLVIIAFILQRLRSRFRFSPMLHQILVMGCLLLGDWLMHRVLYGLLKLPLPEWENLWSVVPGMVLWWPVCALLDAARRHWR